MVRGEKQAGTKMKETGIRKEVIEEIKNLARKYQVKRVILFGSRARGDYKRTSDIDIAVSGVILRVLHWMWKKKRAHSLNLIL